MEGYFSSFSITCRGAKNKLIHMSFPTITGVLLGVVLLSQNAFVVLVNTAKLPCRGAAPFCEQQLIFHSLSRRMSCELLDFYQYQMPHF